MPGRGKGINLDLDDVENLWRFMFNWDTILMRSGLGAMYFPVAALEFIDALIFDEDRTDVLSIREGTDAPGGFEIRFSGEWKPTGRLAELIRDYADNPDATEHARDAAGELRAFLSEGVERPFEVGVWGERSMVRWLREACRPGREIASEHGTWREVLSVGAVGGAVRYLSSRGSNPADAAAAMSSHIAIFNLHHQFGGCDFYLLWNNRGIPTAIAAVAADGTTMSVTAPDGSAADGGKAALLDLAEGVGGTSTLRPGGVL